MKGGRRPPRPTPPDEWLAGLTVIDKNTPAPGLYIYTGEVVGSYGTFVNSVFEIVYIEDAPQLRLSHTGSGQITVFDVDNDRFESLSIGTTSPVAAAQVVSAAGLNFSYGSAANRPLEEFTRAAIVGRIDPTE